MNSESLKPPLRAVHRMDGLTLFTYGTSKRRDVHMTAPPEPDSCLAWVEKLEQLRELCREEAR